MRHSKERTNWFFDCPTHGLEEGMFCSKAYDVKLSERWFKAKYTISKVRTSSEDKKEWVRIMGLTRQYNGYLPG